MKNFGILILGSVLFLTLFVSGLSPYNTGVYYSGGSGNLLQRCLDMCDIFYDCSGCSTPTCENICRIQNLACKRGCEYAERRYPRIADF